jgi:PhnB protein
MVFVRIKAFGGYTEVFQTWRNSGATALRETATGGQRVIHFLICVYEFFPLPSFSLSEDSLHYAHRFALSLVNLKDHIMAVKPVPDGYHTVTPYLVVKGAAKALEFYKKAFGAKERVRMPGPGGQVMHAEVQIGDSMVMLADEFPQMGAQSPQSIGGTPVGMCLYVKNADAAFKKAIAAGAKQERPLKDQFYGDRSGTLIDPFGHKWTIATHIEDVTPKEMEKRMAAEMLAMGAPEAKGKATAAKKRKAK